MHDISAQINNLTAATQEAAAALSRMRAERITPDQVAEGLVCIFRLGGQADLLPLGLNLEAMLHALEPFDFKWLSPIAEVSVEKSIIPEGVPVRFIEAQAKHRNEIWLVHMNDVYPFPSQPHAHNRENGLKLHLGNGNLYRKRLYVNKVRSKDLIAIREKLSQLTLPPLEVN